MPRRNSNADQRPYEGNPDWSWLEADLRWIRAQRLGLDTGRRPPRPRNRSGDDE